MAIQGFVPLEMHHLRSGVSWYEAAASVVRGAIRHYLAHPLILAEPNCVTPFRIQIIWQGNGVLTRNSHRAAPALAGLCYTLAKFDGEGIFR